MELEKLGQVLQKHLVDQKNDVTVVDRSDELINKLREKVDLKTIVGSASNPSVLKEAAVKVPNDNCSYASR